jgi:hypothetical protein
MGGEKAMGDREVRTVVWPWRERKAPTPADRARARYRRCVIEALIMSAAGTLILVWKHHRVPAIILYSMAGLFLVSGMFISPVYNVLKGMVEFLVRVLTTMVNWILLAPFFYVVFTFGRLMLLLKGKDPLCRKCPTDQKTYWMAQPKAPEGVEHFKRLY